MRIGLTVYTQGMIIGLLLMALLVGLVVVPLVLWSSVKWDSPLHEIVISAAAGAIGAFVSVLQRMASDKSKFAVHYDLGKRMLYMLGSYRPVLGVVFGVFTYFVLASGILGTSAAGRTQPVVLLRLARLRRRLQRALHPGAGQERRGPRARAGNAGRVGDRHRRAERLTSSRTPPASVW